MATTSPSDSPAAGVEQRERDAGLQRRARTCPTSSRRPRAAVGVRPACGRAGCHGRWPAAPAAGVAGRPRARRAARRGPRTRPSSTRPPSPRRACTGRDLRAEVLAVQRVAHLGAQRVARAETGRRGRRRSATPRQQRVPQRLGAARPARHQLVAVLAGVAGAAHAHRLAVPVGVGEGHVVAVRSGRPELGLSTSAERGPCTASTPKSLCWSVTRDPGGRRRGEPARRPRRCWPRWAR